MGGKVKYSLRDPGVNEILLANLRMLDGVDSMDWATRKPCANWLLHPFFLFCVCQVGPEFGARLALCGILPVISVWQTTTPCSQNFRAFQGTDDKLFSAQCAKGFFGRGTEEDHCCRWLLSLEPTPLGRGTSPSLWCGTRRWALDESTR